MKSPILFMVYLLTSFCLVVPAKAEFVKVSVPRKKVPVDSQALIEKLKLQKIIQGSSVRTVKIAVLDEGFESGQHGLAMVQIIRTLLGSKVEILPYVAITYSEVQKTVSEVIAQNVDVVLNAQVWTFGGNSDGSGIWASAVQKVTEAGILWVNAAGNYGGRVVSGLVKDIGAKNGVSFSCQPVGMAAACPVKVTLNWDRASNDIGSGTNRDLNFLIQTAPFINPSSGRLETFAVGQSRLRQVTREEWSKEATDISLLPRETWSGNVHAGNYTLLIQKADQSNDSKTSVWDSSSRYQVVVDGMDVTVPEATETENMLPPANDLKVLTVGASDEIHSSKSRINAKPEVWVPSWVKVMDGGYYPSGSSNASAIVAGIAGLVLGQLPADQTKQANFDRKAFVLDTLSRLATGQ